MMSDKKINNSLITRYNTLFLVLTAGCCDAITFTAADEVFSAHVTGNFILFAYDIVNGADLVTWVRLLTFPVFFLAVMTGGWISSASGNKYRILRTEAILLIAGGLASGIMTYAHIISVRTGFAIALLVVFVMGLQNAFGKLFSKDTYGPTTMMTGNTTQAALNLFNYISTGKRPAALTENLKHDALILTGFLCGCLIGALAGKFVGLSGLFIPGILLLGIRKTD